MSDTPTVIVVVPVHDEAQLLDGCLNALEVAVITASERGIRCIVRVVLDDCTDGSASVAARHPFATAEIVAAKVGRARAAGVDSALDELEHRDLHRVWIANTDADSAVPPEWIVVHAALAAAGADLVLGTVRPDFADLSPAHRMHWLRTHPPGAAPGNVHGANLGVRASIYVDVGGFDPVAEHEDVALVARCRLQGAVVRVTEAAEVLTSGRSSGRTPGGYAAFVRGQAALLAAQTPPIAI